VYLLPAWLLLGLLAGATVAAGERNLLVNGSFEQHSGVGTVPEGWQVVDEHAEYYGWIAPRVERRIGRILPRSGRYMIGLDTEMMGVDTRGKDYDTPRSAIYQTITVPGRTRGTFSIYYNDIGTTALSHLSAIHLAYTINHQEIQRIEIPLPLPQEEMAPPGEGAARDPAPASPLSIPPGRRLLPDGSLPPDTWSRAFYRVSQQMPFAEDALGDWSLASIPVRVDADEPTVKLTLWIGIFDRQNSTERGYWRIDDAAFVLDRSSAR
jgi:hypothetical protein